ncbi:MAG: glycoside hydrolase family 88 protein [Butyrivibrio sp.]|jgi:rhamnogalacturonyl hydrolase YesR|nr:glycoside hydrolase family 88 protein [Butyrivibrio sp.]
MMDMTIVDITAGQARRELQETGSCAVHRTIKQCLKQSLENILRGREHVQRKEAEGRQVISAGWKKGVLLSGLLEAGDEKSTADYLHRWILQAKNAEHVDNFSEETDSAVQLILPLTAEDFLSLQCMMKMLLMQKKGQSEAGVGSGVYAEFSAAADAAREYLLRHERDSGGSITYNEKAGNGYIYADGIGMICPFLCAYGIWKKQISALEDALLQIRNFFHCGMDEKSGLPWHAYETDSGKKMGIIGWSRATGWIAFGIAESIRFLKERDSSTGTDDFDCTCRQSSDILAEYLAQLLTAAQTVLLPDALYPWKPGEQKADTSGSAMITYAAAVYQHFCSKTADTDQAGKRGSCPNATLQKALESISGCVQSDGRVLKAQGECIDAGVYSREFASYPWSVGMTLKLFAYMNGENR